MKIKSLRELSRDVAPPDLWPQIAAQLTREAPAASSAATASASARRAMRVRYFAAAAVVATLAVGMWIGRTLLPLNRTEGGALTTGTQATTGAPASLEVAYVSDPRYRQQRAALLNSLQAQLSTLPPDTRAKVLVSLAAIDKAKKDLESALGKDPSNALLQELLVNTYQDEMRVLSDVRAASGQET